MKQDVKIKKKKQKMNTLLYFPVVNNTSAVQQPGRILRILYNCLITKTRIAYLVMRKMINFISILNIR